ncbi:MAG: hypothetical protein ACR2NV_03465 [Thermoleophilaceae bacterium]
MGKLGLKTEDGTRELFEGVGWTGMTLSRMATRAWLLPTHRAGMAIQPLLMADKPESLDVSLAWVGFDETPITFANQFLIQFPSRIRAS